ncbi:hypothetical protein KXD40_001015 [Peronospora effusa]|uniref:Uncharacterized protein n=1 Tax=Peronospora effusa TaxID=542832 RepID=A0A3M6VMV0_9STRA|nr:hypothetical protein DD238_000734 [Peronospora effusa]UIZ21231.1 hypothetical protein KXD40_001015 [Peronospora effusa]CAI5724217.1 unnamed protein product [Peronospora effusa]
MERNDSTSEETTFSSSSSNALNIIESDEQDFNAEALAEVATSGMEMNLELPIRSFLTRNEAEEEDEAKSKQSAYEVLRNGAVHYSRREDKIRELQKHPVVAFIAADGRTVGCKCGRNVRLNPPWYILKFEQHVASRNCTFLRQNNKKRKREKREADGSLEELEEREKVVHIDSGQEQVVEGGDQDDGEGTNNYSLQSVDVILQREFGLVTNGQQTIGPPSDTLSQDRLRMFKGAVVLRDNPQFKRITPDGRFAECKCSRIILLSAPWHPGQFLMHVAEKQKPKKRAKTASAVVKSVERKKRVYASGLSSSTAGRSVISLGLPMRPTIANAFLQAHKVKKSFPREIRWDIARARGLLPCPGLRDDRMKMFVTSAIQLTGGARYRQKIARELFPHLFLDSSEYDPTDEVDHEVELDHSDSQSSLKKRQPKLQQQLLEAEKLLLHDVIEGEALWFVDKDGNSVRSLDCLGIVDSGKGDTRCASCTMLRSNAALRTAAATKYKNAMLSGPPRNPINRKFCSGCVCSLLEAEFDMREPFARVLRDLALADIPSALNTWMEMATMGLSGVFDTHPALLGLTEAMVRLKDKEQRGVGLQNMTYSNLLDTFMRSLADLSPDACELFQKHLGGRKQRQLQAVAVKSVVPSRRRLQLQTSSDVSQTGQDQQIGEPFYDGVGNSATAVRVTSDEGFVHLLDPSVVGFEMPPLSINDIQDVDLSTFPASSAIQLHGNQSNNLVHDDEVILSVSPGVAESALSSESNPAIEQACKESECQGDIRINSTTETTSLEVVTSVARQNYDDVTDEPKDTVTEGQTDSDSDAVAFLTELPSLKNSSKTNDALMPSDHVPCTGLRDENVQAYVANAVQIVGGSRPRYVIARELFPQVFGNDKKVRIVDKLSNEQRLILQDAVFSECLWRVDKEGRCVRSLRCKRFVPAPRNHDRGSSQSQGVCRACRDLRTVPNFRSVLSRSKMPKKLENIKYVPSVYTESDPFLRKLSKNSAFRGLYQCVKSMVGQELEKGSEVGTERLKRVHFWLRFARMGIFGHFKSHPVFEGLMKSMVEVKDKERRGVGKQNMQYSPALDEFMQNMVQISTEAFELFAANFCGRTLRSQKVKRRTTPVFTTPAKTAELPSFEGNSGGVVFTAHSPIAQSQPYQHQHYLMAPDDLLSGRHLSSEESQRFMDCMLDEVRLSVSREMQLVAEEERRGVGNAGNIPANSAEHEQQTDEGDVNHYSPETYLNDEGVLVTEI